ncbi:MAG: hypothetical protein IPK70_16725 [Flavobacteriales bacterium]|jgi:hypothetical protein|nr:hypothetical protein [Flavobacteriales bacterium]
MKTARPLHASRMTLRLAGVCVLLCSALVFTPQTMGWLCSTSWVELGFKAPPLLEEEVVKHSESLFDHGLALEGFGSALFVRLPFPMDEEVMAGPLAKVSVPPPKTC